MDKLETPRAARQVGHRLLGEVGPVVVQHDTDNGLARAVRMQAFEQGDELATAMARLALPNLPCRLKRNRREGMIARDHNDVNVLAQRRTRGTGVRIRLWKAPCATLAAE